jgi:hypothetical protein
MKKAVLREYLKNREKKVLDAKNEKNASKPKTKRIFASKKGDK